MAKKQPKSKTEAAKFAKAPNKTKEEGIVLEGTVTEAQRGKFLVEIVKEGKSPGDDDRSFIITAHLAGKMRKHNIRIVQGDKVRVEVSPYDLQKGRIIYRLK